VHTLLYFEAHADTYAAIQREKRLKKWNRAWKIRLSNSLNGIPAFAGTTT
jgi:putative endonuclease